ncbi:cupin domain-containing protein [Lichenihabitans psoromatis]|uniref:cupin domain-containing protein n=1 Tax=Lichenihabitans psoromatis TaxID=2528642 RepID=UPI0010357FF2|nr:cupin domain-containing protein [Lichenihabitans psoromatis]
MADPSSRPEATPTVPYWHAYVDQDGVSRQKRCALTAFEQKSMSGAAPQWNDTLSMAPSGVTICVLPVGWVGDWHENPKPQWIIPLSGRWFVETMDGTRVEMGVGEISFGEDQDCTADHEGHVGHRSGTLGDVPCVQMIVQLDITPTVNEPGHWI